MKGDDIAMVVFIAIAGAVVSFFAVNALMGDMSDKSEKVDFPMQITSDLADPDPEIFNAEAINPTVEVYVGNCKDDDHDGLLSEAELEACGESGLVTDVMKK